MSIVVNRISTRSTIVPGRSVRGSQGDRGEHGHDRGARLPQRVRRRPARPWLKVALGALNAVKVALGALNAPKATFSRSLGQATEMASWCRPGPSAVTEVSPLPLRCRARTVQSPGAA